MKTKIFTIATVLIIGILIFAAASPASAAELGRGGPPTNGGGTGGNGRGSQGAQGSQGTGTGIPVDQSINLDGILNEMIYANLVDSMGNISLEELTARLAAGETLTEVALSLGFDTATISEMISQARVDALAQAVAEGLITQEQADWLASRGNTASGGGNNGASTCDSLTGDCIPDGTSQNTMQKSGFRKGSGR